MSGHFGTHRPKRGAGQAEGEAAVLDVFARLDG